MGNQMLAAAGACGTKDRRGPCCRPCAPCEKRVPRPAPALPPALAPPPDQVPECDWARRLRCCGCCARTGVEESGIVAERRRHDPFRDELVGGLAEYSLDQDALIFPHSLGAAVCKRRPASGSDGEEDGVRKRSRVSAAQAEALQRMVLGARERRLGREHRETLLARSSLAATLGSQGRHAEAEPLLRAVLQTKEGALGDSHPDSVLALVDLLETLGALGRDAELEPLQRRLLGIRERALGRRHPLTLAALSNLAATLSSLGRVREAERLALDAMERALRQDQAEPDHPANLLVLSSVAATLGNLGRDAQAEPLLRRVLEVLEQSLGGEHPDTLLVLGNLAVTLGNLGRHAEAEPLLRRLLSSRERALGAVHPDTIAALERLTLAVSAQVGAWEPGAAE